MPRFLFFAVFVIVVTTVILAWHYYLWIRLVRDPEPSPKLRKLGKFLVIALAPAFPVSMFAERSFPFEPLRPLYMIGFGWLGVSFVLVMALLVADIAKLGVWSVKKLARKEPIEPERRRTLARIIAGVTMAAGFSSAAIGAPTALGMIPVERLTIALRRLSLGMSGTRIVQLTDLHIGPILKRDWVERVVEQVNGLDADVVVITGDLVDGKVERLAQDVAPLRELKAKYGVYFVTGNHEYFSGAEPWMEELKRLGIRVLSNEHVLIGPEADAFCLAGVHDFSAGQHGEGHVHDVQAALRGVDPLREVILLAHQPRSIREAAEHGIGLQLSGHTHGGQIFPWRYFVYLQQPFVTGLHRVRDTLLYISRGTGFWGPPIRFGAPPEITLIELQKA